VDPTTTWHKTVSHWLAAAIPIGTFTALLAAFFLIAVARPGVRRRVWPGAGLTVTIGVFMSAGFAYYASTIARFTLFYGSLAVVAIMLAWIWLWCWALLVGAELNAVLEELAVQPPSPASPTQTPQLDGKSAED
jgi:membrane protein